MLMWKWKWGGGREEEVVGKVGIRSRERGSGKGSRVSDEAILSLSSLN